MAEEIKTFHKHWREMTDKNYLVAEQFEEGVDRIYTIKAVIEEVIENPVKKGSDGNPLTSTKPVLIFEETDFKLALNKANDRMLTRLFGTGFVDEWVGRKIQLFATTTEAFGGTVSCIRIRNFLPEFKCCVCGKEITEGFEILFFIIISLALIF